MLTLLLLGLKFSLSFRVSCPSTNLEHPQRTSLCQPGLSDLADVSPCDVRGQIKEGRGTCVPSPHTSWGSPGLW
jgi:hypothetical protein